MMKPNLPRFASLLAFVAAFIPSHSAFANPVFWTDWTSGNAGSNGSAVGQINTGTDTIDVTYTGEIAFLQTNGGTNYWNPSSPYISTAVDNAPGTPDIIALSSTTLKTLTFSKPVDNLFFAVVSLNGNGYVFNSDFDVVSYGTGFWGSGTLTKTDLGGGQWMTSGSGEPHGVIRFTQPVTSISWTSRANEYWNGFTVGTYGVARTPDSGTTALLLTGALGTLAMFSRRRPRRS